MRYENQSFVEREDWNEFLQVLKTKQSAGFYVTSLANGW
jgi:hypothetical protein